MRVCVPFRGGTSFTFNLLLFITMTTTQSHVFSGLLIACAILVGLFSADTNIHQQLQADTATTSVTVGNSNPVLTALSLNGGSAITLTENTFTTATGTLTVTDANGCSSISSVTAVAYRSPQTTSGSNCSQNDNNCYTVTCTQDTGTCVSTSADYSCAFDFWYIADPTDAGSANATDIWVFAATGTDSAAGTGTATNSAQTVEINSLLALDVTATIPYGTVGAGADTGSINATATITNTGNAPQDNELSGVGSGMCTDYPTCSSDPLTFDNQEYSLTTFTYGAGTDLSGTAAEVETNLAKATATTTASTDATYWGIGIPGGTSAGSYTGQNLFTAKVED